MWSIFAKCLNFILILWDFFILLVIVLYDIVQDKQIENKLYITINLYWRTEWIISIYYDCILQLVSMNKHRTNCMVRWLISCSKIRPNIVGWLDHLALFMKKFVLIIWYELIWINVVQCDQTVFSWLNFRILPSFSIERKNELL